MSNPANISSPQADRQLIFPASKRRAAFGLVEQVVSMGILAIVLAACIAGMLQANRQATIYRARTAARAVVERNIENALNVTYDSVTTPPILAITAAGGVVYDDEGDGDNLVDIVVQDSAGTNKMIKGTLTRIVLAETNPQGAPIRRVTFTLTYALRGKNYTTSMTTLRAIDDF